MIELRDRKQLEEAIQRARREPKTLLVQLTGLTRQYHVTNRRNGHSYTVFFEIHEDGKRFGHCTCVAGEYDLLCKHIAAAAALNCYVAEQGLLERQFLTAK